MTVTRSASVPTASVDRSTGLRSARFAALAVLALGASACASGTAAPVGPAPTGPVADAPAPDASTPITEGVDYVVYRSDGTPATFEDIVAAAGESDAVLLGEEHNDPITHRMQYRIFRAVAERYDGAGPMVHPSADGSRAPNAGGGREVVLTLEMFERDVQYIVDEYLADMITESHFQASARPWGNYQTDYRPLVELAKASGIPVVAANAPRRYVNVASREGRDAVAALPATAKRYLPPLPYPRPTPAYQAEWDALMGGAPMHGAGDPMDGQSLWDAAMGNAITTVLDETPGGLVVHLAGGFHVENHTGTPDAIQHYRPGTRTLVVAMRPAADPTVFGEDRAGLGDFVVLTRAPGGD